MLKYSVCGTAEDPRFRLVAQTGRAQWEIWHPTGEFYRFVRQFCSIANLYFTEIAKLNELIPCFWVCFLATVAMLENARSGRMTTHTHLRAHDDLGLPVVEHDSSIWAALLIHNFMVLWVTSGAQNIAMDFLDDILTDGKQKKRTKEIDSIRTVLQYILPVTPMQRSK